MASDLSRLKRIWTEVTARGKEHFRRPEDPTQGTWPPEYPEILGIAPGHDMVEDPARAITKSAYLVNYEAARHMAMVAKAQELLGLQTPGQARELVAACPELEHGLEPFFGIWNWFELTSGLYTSQTGEQQEQHLKMMPALISNLIWKLKMQERAATQVSGDPEPLLNLQTLREALVDIAFVPAWAKGSTSFFKKNIDAETAKKFAQDCQAMPTQATPYTYAAVCPACDTITAPGTLADHIKECTLADQEGNRLRCKCAKEFKTIAALSQHRVLHCRRATTCPACGGPAEQQPCRCQSRRSTLCQEILKLIQQTAHGTGNIYDLTNETAIVATQEELRSLLKTVTDMEQQRGEAPIAMTPTWRLMGEDHMTPEPWGREQDLAKVEFPHTPGREDSDLNSSLPSLPRPEDSDDDTSLYGNHRGTERCEICQESFPDMQQLQMHIRDRHADPFRCDLCRAQHKSAPSLIKHMDSHTLCRHCDRLFFNEGACLEHEKVDHKIFRCPTCGNIESSAQALATHRISTCVLTCEFCQETNLTKTTIKMHMNECHPKCKNCDTRYEDSRSYVDHLPCNLIEDWPEKKPRNCGICGKTFGTKSEYTQHLPCGPTPKGHTCPTCPTRWSTEKELDQHIRTTHPRCDHCSRSFKTLIEFLKHNPCKMAQRKTISSPELYGCEKCGTPFASAAALLDHDQSHHQRTPRSPLACISCKAQVEEQMFMEHTRQHTKLYRWNLKGLTCPKCPGVSLESIAEALEHMMNTHKEAFPGFTSAVEAEKPAGRHLTEDQALVRAVRKAMGAEDDFKCSYENCRQIFFTAEELEEHKKLHECKTCGFLPNNPRELSDHEKQHGKSRTEGTYPCNKCGQKLATFEELSAHEDAHNKYACNRCRQKFSSTIEQNKHELTCGAINGMDVFGAAASSDPTMVLAKCLQTMVSATAGSLEPGTADLMRDQIKKAISTQSGKSTLRKNYNAQKTFTFIKSPPFQPSNTVTIYSDKDTSPLKASLFAGTGSPEENYTRLNDLVQNIARIVRSRSLTRDIATDLLLQHLKSPAKDLANSYKEEFELRFGSTAIPEFQDLLLYLETTFINIRPQHAREQLLALKRSNGESMTGFYIRAWRCSHFASFTEKEAERPRFRETLVKEAVMRNLAPRQRESIDQEELQRGLRDEAPMGPREIVDYLNNIKSQKEAMESDRARPDFTTVGQLSSKIRTTSKDNRNSTREAGPRGRSARGRGGSTRRGGTKRTPGKGQERHEGNPTEPRGARNGDNGWIRTDSEIRTVKKHKPKPIRRVETSPQNQGKKPREDRNVREWIEAATAVTGQDACWKCARKGHSHKDCRTYTLLTRRPCPTCKTGYHHPKACRKDKPTWEAKPSRGRGKQNPGFKQARYTWTKEAANTRPGPATGANRVEPRGKGPVQDGRWPGKNSRANGNAQTRKPFVRMNRVHKEQDLVEKFLSELRDRH